MAFISACHLSHVYLTPADKCPAEKQAWVGQQCEEPCCARQSAGQLLQPRTATSQLPSPLQRETKRQSPELGLSIRRTMAGEGMDIAVEVCGEDWTQDHAHAEARVLQLSSTHVSM